MIAYELYFQLRLFDNFIVFLKIKGVIMVIKVFIDIRICVILRFVWGVFRFLFLFFLGFEMNF